MMKNIFLTKIFNAGHQKTDAGQIKFLKISISLLLILTTFLVISCELTDDLKEIRADELKNMIDEKAQAFIVDNRSEFEYRESHIPGAINIPQHQFSSLESLLPKDKSLPIVFYCRGSG